MAAKRYSGNGYWISQLVASGVIGLALLIGGVWGMASDSEEPGSWFIYVLLSIPFLVCFFWLLRTFRRSSRRQRAIYAWAIMQQHGALKRTTDHRDDLAAMGLAQRARDGELSADELNALKALRPDAPYPGDPPATDDVPPSRANPSNS